MAIVSFTGHRSNKIGGYNLPNPTYIKICQALEKTLLELKPEKAITGMAQGFDQYAAIVCYKLKIPFIAAIPFLGQESQWPEKSQKMYHRILKYATDIIIVSPGSYSPAKMQIRNQFMTDKADTIIACWDGTPGGTKNCLDYAKSNNKPIIRINPNEL